MQRRVFLGVLGGAAAWPLAARAQQTRILKVGVLYPGLATSAVTRVAAFREGLHNGGIAPDDVEVIVLAAEGDPDRVARLALELVERNVDVRCVRRVRVRDEQPYPDRLLQPARSPRHRLARSRHCASPHETLLRGSPRM